MRPGRNTEIKEGGKERKKIRTMDERENRKRERKEELTFAA